MEPEFIEFLQRGVTLYVILVLSLSVHEWAHAFVADKLGDRLPRAMGRVTLNPIAHMDLLGTVILPLIMIFLSPGFAIFGWGKPVMINPKSFKRYALCDILVSMAGPFSNLVMALILAVAGGFLMRWMPQLGEPITLAMWINVILAVFNLLPIPPLDGSHVLKHAIGMGDVAYMNFARWGFLILLLLINFPPFRAFLMFAIQLVYAPYMYLFSLVFAGSL